MTYLFSGFFAPADADFLAEILEEWPRCRGRLIETPFAGFGVSCPTQASTAEEDLANKALAKKMKRVLRKWSIRYPTVNFVWFDVECVAGKCLYWGFVCRDGDTIAVETNEDEHESDQALLRLLSYLGVSQQTKHFEPFARGFFSEDPEQIIQR